jgi:DNA mismatch endonuclease, patch repair protein
MALIKGANTKPELILRSGLHRAGLRFRVHQAQLPGRPDIVLRRFSAIVFVHGCFWHRHRGCSNAVLPKSRREFWQEKLAANVTRDAAQIRALRTMGWRVLIVWECALNRRVVVAQTVTKAVRWIRGTSGYAEIPSVPRITSPKPV